MVGLSQPMLDAVGDADAVRDVWAEDAAAGAGAVLRQAGEGHIVVGQHGVDLVGKNLDYVPQKSCTFHLSGAVVELDKSELRNAVGGKEHDKLSIGNGAIRSCRCGRNPCQRRRQRCSRLRLRMRMISRRQPSTSFSGSSVFWRTFLDRRQPPGRLGAHRSIGRRGPLASSGDGLRLQSIAGGKGPGAFVRHLEFGSKTRCRAGAAMKNTSHNAASS